MEKAYIPEMVFGILAHLQNMVLIVACAWGVVSLYRVSGSWHSLWLLLMLAALGKVTFIRD